MKSKKSNYYELQVQVYVPQKGYTTVFAYVGNRSNANRKFRSFIKDQFILPSHVFRVRTFSNVYTAIADAPSCVTPFYP